MQTARQIDVVLKHIEAEFGAEPEFLWPERYPSYAVFRHSDTKKWFALVATISATSLGLKDGKQIDIINLKFGKKTNLRLRRNERSYFSGLSHEQK